MLQFKPCYCTKETCGQPVHLPSPDAPIIKLPEFEGQTLIPPAQSTSEWCQTMTPRQVWR